MSFIFKDDQKSWDDSILKQNSHFMQSFLWGKFRQKNNISVFRIKNGKYLIQIEKRKLPLGKCYFYIVGIRLGSKKYKIEPLLEKIKELAKKENAIFLKWEPLQEAQNGILEQKIGQSWIKSINIQPKNTLILDISLSEDNLLKSFHRKHRYNIKLAVKKGIYVKRITTEEGFENFYKLIKKTDERKRTKSFTKKYYQELFSLSQEFPQLKLAEDGPPQNLRVVFLGAYLKNTLIAGLVLIVWNKSATYLVGASDYKYRQYMAPHLLQWEAMKLVKKMGTNYYDFWGIIQENEFSSKTDFEHHPWAGITRFKNGFGGKIINYAPAYDYVLNQFWYKLYKLIKKIKMIV